MHDAAEASARPGPHDRPGPDEPCPCGGGSYGTCCGPTLDEGAEPATAERLMRSRYTAFALCDRGHLLRSWHPSTRPGALELDDGTEWRRLVVIDTVGGGTGDATGVVEFRAVFREGGTRGELHERSRFVRDDGRWSYLDGELLD
ncbi:YchJ family protein [Agromyces soli]